MSAAPGVRTQDRPCADGLEQSALRLHRRAVPREAAFWLVGYVFGAVTGHRPAVRCMPSTSVSGISPRVSSP